MNGFSGPFLPSKYYSLQTSKCTRMNRSDFVQENSPKKVAVNTDMNIIPINISKRIHLNI